MSPCHPKSAHRRTLAALPRLWLMTDERVANDKIMSAIERLPRGSGVIFRHHATEPEERRALFRKLRLATRRRRIVLIGSAPSDREADGVHLSARSRASRGPRPTGLLTMSAHDAREVARANALRPALLFLSPVFPTRSHPGAWTLGVPGLARLARLSDAPVIALGGMNARRFRRLRPLGIHGWAAIDALT